ncbi:TonB-dependent receptor [Salegentibacter sediminis]|uniref:TonB-dependent receptor n=1 Tax=Salegentibacter sediminis TaxID=1930251 RepID=UPI0009BD559E|nr:TonB-dependent receptor [Salegentibacter sediminis]
MKKSIILIGFWLGFNSGFAQETSVKGRVVDAVTYKNIQGVIVVIENTSHTTNTDEVGSFKFTGENLPVGNKVLHFSKESYLDLRLPVVIEPRVEKDLDLIPFQNDLLQEQLQISTISLSADELNEDEASVDNIAGLLQASRDVFLNAAAFDFSQTFFRPRGYDSEHAKVLINGIEMNKIFTGRPQWSNWGGLNDVQRNQVFSMGFAPSEVSFGGLAGTTNIIMRASQYSRGGRISYAFANRSYNGRVMGSYSSGELKNGWAFSVSASRRFAEEAYNDGTLYDANAFYIAVEKKLNESHSVNFTGFYTPNIRGKSSPNTQEVFDLKGRRYNAYWGYQDGEMRNSRVREIKEPVLMLNHFWKVSDKTEINSNILFQFGKTGNSRIDYGGTRLVMLNDQESFIGGGANPDPTYYQKLPGYFLRFSDNPNYEAAFRARDNFNEEGQLDWAKLYAANQSAGYSIYALSEDRNDDKLMSANAIISSELSPNISLNSKLSFTSLKSHNFASVKDLLGGSGYLDIDIFAEGDAETSLGDRAQSDLQNPNRIVGVDEPYKYNFELHATNTEAFLQLQFNYSQADFYFGANFSQSTYQRNGLFQNGNFPDNSLGKSKKLEFTGYGLKAGGTYRLTGRHLFSVNAAYLTKPPNLRNSFSNSRQNNETVVDIDTEKIYTADLSYRYQAPKLKARLTGYFTQINDATEISFYYADGLSGLGRTSTTAFVQEILSGIGKRHFGAELGLESQITTTIKLKAAAAVGQYTYSNNPYLYLTSDDFHEAVHYGTSYLKNYRIAGGPQQAVQLGFEYRDPGFWWFGTSINFFSHAFLDISPLSRTANFKQDTDGLPLLNYDEDIARELLEQEQFQEYFLINVIGGKSWLIKGKYLGFFVSLNNIFDELYKTGGFEQSRNANYRTLKTDQNRDYPVFNPKYWYGTGASYYANIYVRF